MEDCNDRNLQCMSHGLYIPLFPKRFSERFAVSSFSNSGKPYDDTAAESFFLVTFEKEDFCQKSMNPKWNSSTGKFIYRIQDSASEMKSD